MNLQYSRISTYCFLPLKHHGWSLSLFYTKLDDLEVTLRTEVTLRLELMTLEGLRSELMTSLWETAFFVGNFLLCGKLSSVWETSFCVGLMTIRGLLMTIRGLLMTISGRGLTIIQGPLMNI